LGLKNATSQKDKDGKPIEGTSIFDKIGGLLGKTGGTKKDGSSPGSALYVFDVSKTGGTGIPGTSNPSGNPFPATAGALPGGVIPFVAPNSGIGKSAANGQEAKNDAASKLRLGSSLASSSGTNWGSLIGLGLGLVSKFLPSRGGGPGLDPNSGEAYQANDLYNGSTAETFGYDTGGTFADGGLLSGPGSGTSDSIPINVSDGEYIMTAAKTKPWFGLLEAIRTGKVDDKKASALHALATGAKSAIKRAIGGIVGDGEPLPMASYAGGGFVQSIARMMSSSYFAEGGLAALGDRSITVYHAQNVCWWRSSK